VRVFGTPAPGPDTEPVLEQTGERRGRRAGRPRARVPLVRPGVPRFPAYGDRGRPGSAEKRDSVRESHSHAQGSPDFQPTTERRRTRSAGRREPVRESHSYAQGPPGFHATGVHRQVRAVASRLSTAHRPPRRTGSTGPLNRR
jgi:hypothetical protein